MSRCAWAWWVVALLAAPARAGEGEAPRASGWSWGDAPEVRLELTLEALLVDIKHRSHVTFGGRGAEVAYVDDLGLETPTPAWGARVSLGLARAGWLGLEVLGLEQEGQAAVITRPRRLGDVALAPGDVTRSDVQLLWGRLRYGWGVRRRLALGAGLELDLWGAPTVGLGVYRIGVSVDRVHPDPGPVLEVRHPTGVVAVPGVRGGVELVGWGALLVEYEAIPSPAPWLSLSHVTVAEWERLRLALALRLGPAVVEVGVRTQNSELDDEEDARDGKSSLRLRGLDVALGVAF